MADDESGELFRSVIDGVSQQYSGCLANDNVSLTLKRSTLYALLSETGAGKINLMKISDGIGSPDSGGMVW